MFDVINKDFWRIAFWTKKELIYFTENVLKVGGGCFFYSSQSCESSLCPYFGWLLFSILDFYPLNTLRNGCQKRHLTFLCCLSNFRTKTLIDLCCLLASYSRDVWCNSLDSSSFLTNYCFLKYQQTHLQCKESEPAQVERIEHITLPCLNFQLTFFLFGK